MTQVRFAIPKGSLETKTAAFLERAGLKPSGYADGSRSYRPELDLPGVTVKVLRPQEIPYMISAGFYKAYSELVPEFERETGHRLITTRGPSQGDSPEAIPNRLKRGEPADVLLMIGASIDNLIDQGLVRAGSKVDIAQSEIGMVVRAGASMPDTIAFTSSIRLCCRSSQVPAGRWSDLSPVGLNTDCCAYPMRTKT